jgi:uncharacterized protein
MRNQKDRVIIDTNIWISFLLTKDYKKLDRIINHRKIIIVVSKELIEEIIEVTQREKFKKYFAFRDLKDLLKRIESRSVFVNVKSEVSECRDSKDNFLLSLALDGKATHLITGDKDLLILKKFQKAKILSITEYLLTV